MVDSVESCAQFTDSDGDARHEAFVLAPTLVASSLHHCAFERNAEPRVPVWALQQAVPDFNESQITSFETTVVTPMLTNVMGRRGSPYSLVFGDRRDGIAGRSVVMAVRAVHSINNGRLANLDSPLEGGFEFPAGRQLSSGSPHTNWRSGSLASLLLREIPHARPLPTPLLAVRSALTDPSRGRGRNGSTPSVNYHNALSPDYLAAGVEMAAEFLGVGGVRV